MWAERGGLGASWRGIRPSGGGGGAGVGSGVVWGERAERAVGAHHVPAALAADAVTRRGTPARRCRMAGPRGDPAGTPPPPPLADAGREGGSRKGGLPLTGETLGLPVAFRGQPCTRPAPVWQATFGQCAGGRGWAAAGVETNLANQSRHAPTRPAADRPPPLLPPTPTQRSRRVCPDRYVVGVLRGAGHPSSPPPPSLLLVAATPFAQPC